MYNEIIEIIKTWSGFGQFLFLFIVLGFILSITALIVHTVGKFFIKTLPVLLRGWPPTCLGTNVLDDDNG